MNARVDELRPATSLTTTAESGVSAVSWSAIWAGAIAAAALSLLLLTLGAGLGFASLSPWPGDGPSPTTFSVVSAIWLIVVQWLASALGGYLAGRTRTKWTGVHTHEVAFRDTMHGFATWALATLITAVVVAYAAVGTVSGTAKVLSSAGSDAPRSQRFWTRPASSYSSPDRRTRLPDSLVARRLAAFLRLSLLPP